MFESAKVAFWSKQTASWSEIKKRYKECWKKKCVINSQLTFPFYYEVWLTITIVLMGYKKQGFRLNSGTQRVFSVKYRLEFSDYSRMAKKF